MKSRTKPKTSDKPAKVRKAAVARLVQSRAPTIDGPWSEVSVIASGAIHLATK